MDNLAPETAMFDVKVTIDELTLLDGNCRPEIQAIVDHAKATRAIGSVLPEREAKMVAELVAIAKSKGRLTWSTKPIRTCPCCGRDDGYHLAARTTQRRTKGRPDYSKPKRFAGYDMDRGFIGVEGHISKGVCVGCKDRVLPVLAAQLTAVDAEIPEQITGHKPLFKRHDMMECVDCHWLGHECQLKPLPAVMGGYYPGECPSCSAKNLFMGPAKIKRAEGFALIPTAK